MSGMRSALALSMLMAAGVYSAPAHAEAWRTYVNDRFGATASYPERFSVRDEPPANGDGQRFRTADSRATLAVFGFIDGLEETPKQIMESRRNADVTYTLADARAASFTLSGRRGDRITYQRCLRSTRDKSIFVCIDLDYPASELAAYDPIVKRIAGSLRAGKGW